MGVCGTYSLAKCFAIGKVPLISPLDFGRLLQISPRRRAPDGNRPPCPEQNGCAQTNLL